MKMYAYTDPIFDSSKPELVTYEVIKETKCGYWVVPSWDYQLGGYQVRDENKKFVLKGNNGKRRCYDSIEAALEGYIHKKYRQVAILNGRLDFAKKMYKAANDLKNENLNAQKPAQNNA